VRTIGVVLAMRAEAAPLLDALGAIEVDAPAGGDGLPQRWHVATRGRVDLVFVVNGVDPHHGVDSIATQPTVLSTYLLCRNWPVELVMSVGVAGAWASRGGAVGDVYVSRDRFVYHDRRIDIAGFPPYGVGSFAAVPASRLARELGLKEGIVTTGNSLDETDADRRLIDASGASVKDMEAAAVADVARLHGVPVLALKAITDLVDEEVPTVEQFLANFALATARLRDAMLGVVDWCAERRIAELGDTELGDTELANTELGDSELGDAKQ
jgi:5'-methylthioadenosine nucleosidase